MLPVENSGSIRVRPSLFSPFIWPEAVEEIFKPVLGSGTSKGFKLDVLERGDGYQITADLPGYRKDQVDISFENGLLSITAKKSGESDKEEKGYLLQERWRGTMTRSISLPQDANREDIKATLKEGILTISVMKRPDKQPKRIDIK